MNRLVCGAGVNDADYAVVIKETIGQTKDGKRMQKQIWFCPFYRKWASMLNRCYGEKYHSRKTYTECSIVDEWKYFMTFRDWMEKQEWEGKELDKDLLFPGNKVYGPDTCVFLDRKINSFLTESKASRGELPIGVYFHKNRKKFIAQSNDATTGKRKYLGDYKSSEEAYLAWLSFKQDQAKILASEQKDPRIAKALIDRYTNYQLI